MGSSDFWQRLSASLASPEAWDIDDAPTLPRGSQGKVRFWMAIDAVTVLCATTAAAIYYLHTSPLNSARYFWHGALVNGRSMSVLLALLGWYVLSLILVSRRLRLYTPVRIPSFLNEQRLSVQACLTAGLLLTGTLYLIHGGDIPRTIVLTTVGLTTVALSLRRFLYRIILYRRFERGMDTRNVLIVGTGPEANALRRHLDRMKHLGYAFKGFIELPGAPVSVDASDIVGSLDTLFRNTRKNFVDEIFFTTPCERGIVQHVLEESRLRGVDLRIVPDMYDSMTWYHPVEYIGQFPTIPLHRGEAANLGLVFKRIFDVAFSILVLLFLVPLFLVIALVIKLDSPGPVFYASDRIGKKGVVFRCIKFRTMVQDAESRRDELLNLNERDGVLFKVSNDPRVTRVGRFLRKYSLDELPQLFNVLQGEMSIVGPRPPLAGEVRQYHLGHLRRLDVTPGITGLWQVQARSDPSFSSYVSLDVTYIDNWSVWLDFKIILRTIGVIFAGTGS